MAGRRPPIGARTDSERTGVSASSRRAASVRLQSRIATEVQSDVPIQGPSTPHRDGLNRLRRGTHQGPPAGEIWSTPTHRWVLTRRRQAGGAGRRDRRSKRSRSLPGAGRVRVVESVDRRRRRCHELDAQCATSRSTGDVRVGRPERPCATAGRARCPVTSGRSPINVVISRGWLDGCFGPWRRLFSPAGSEGSAPCGTSALIHRAIAIRPNRRHCRTRCVLAPLPSPWRADRELASRLEVLAQDRRGLWPSPDGVRDDEQC